MKNKKTKTKLSLGFRLSLMCLTVQLWLVTSHLRLDLIEVRSDAGRRNPEDTSLSMDPAKRGAPSFELSAR